MSDYDDEKTILRGGAQRGPARPAPARPDPEATMVSPPGAGPAGQYRAPAYGPPPAPPPSPPPAPSMASGMAGATLARAGATVNVLLDAALPILLLATQLRGSVRTIDAEMLRQRIEEDMRRFETDTAQRGADADDALAARYVLCALLDECVLGTPWGSQSSWIARTLEVTFYHSAVGGEKVYQIVDWVLGNPRRNPDLAELLHACLAVGFEGQFRSDPRGPARVAEYQRQLADAVRRQRGSAPADLAISWMGVQDPRPRLTRYIPLWVVAVATLCIVLLAYLGFRLALDPVAAPVNAALASIGNEPMYQRGSVILPSGPSIRELLAPQERAGQVQIEENGPRTLIRLTVGELFASGSDTPAGAVQPLLEDIGRALDKVPGHVLVIGHTDDQPLRSLRFESNFELSRARAQAVAQLLARTFTRGGVQVIGKGSDSPLANPPGLPENRARNRRVEIEHQAGM